ncbi:MAG: DUF3108 domain-containing protein [Hydrogenophaga sp.]|uniref:DUF3108 domain-containing protein n=1 Tax=Hydrogenophaga sp. TaxID=1904254 RepID=UPI003D0D9791
MPDVTQGPISPDPAPRWPTLLGLGLGVLVLHLVLLTGGLPDFSARSAPASLADPPTALKSDPTPRSSEAMARSASVHISQVRWIVPAPASSPEPVRQVAPTTPTKKTSAKAAAAKPAAPVLDAPAAEPLPAPAHEAAAPEDPAILAQAVAAEPAMPMAGLSKPPKGLPLPPAQPPASARLQYVVAGKIKGFSYSATGTLDWELAGDRYSARMEMRMPLLGSRVQTSTGSVGPEGLMPERFADKGRSERAAHFERAQHRIRFSVNTPEAELLPGAQDRLSLFMQIAGLLQARPQAYASGQVIDMQVAGTGDAEIWRFQVGEEITLALPAGELRVRHLVRLPRKEFDSTVEMWLAPDLKHLPVRLKVTQANGDMADQQLAQKP